MSMTSLDVDMVSAICPNCRILLVEASAPTQVDLGAGVNSAIKLGAVYVSNSCGGKQNQNDPPTTRSTTSIRGV